MPEYICLVKKENSAKAEETLRKDFDLAAKQSITVKDASALGLKSEGSIFYIRGSEEGVNKCKELLKEFVQPAKESDLELAKKKILEEEESAMAGFGGILG